ncbi:MAG: DUF4358 domain-containing protein [Clostridia bacterium]|nr:DUF4358 domain-containing protein [Clostridia bacterium]
MKKIIALILALVLVFSFAGCTGNEETKEPETTNINVEDVYASIENAVELNEMTILGEDMILNLLGIEAEKTVQLKVAEAADGLLADEIWLVEAVDEAAAKEIVDLANTRIELQAAASKTYSPEQHEIVNKAQIITNGNFVAFIVSPSVDDIVAIVNEAFGK